MRKTTDKQKTLTKTRRMMPLSEYEKEQGVTHKGKRRTLSEER